MTVRSFLEMVSQFFIIFPSAILCYLPMVKKLRFPLKKILLWEFGILLVLSPVMAFLCLRFGLSINTLLIPALILFYIMFRGTVTTGKMQTLAVFVGVCNLMSFPSVYSVMYDAYLHPDGLLENYSMEANIFSLVLTLILSEVIGYPLCVKGSELIEHQTSEKVWGLTIPVSLVMLMINYSIEPVYYRNMYVGRMFFLAIMIITAMLLLLMFLMVIFYYAAMSIYQNEQTKAKARMLEMQESRYLRLQDYIEKTRKLRHDFRQSIHVMNTLAAEEDYDTLKKYLAEYEAQMPVGLTDYCRINSVNALLNYYGQWAEQNGIKLSWKIQLPDDAGISQPDLCSVLGNVVENALDGCMTAQTGERYHQLSVVCEEPYIYIVSTNSFDGNVKEKNGSFMSTKHKGMGTGIPSIKAAVEKYNGTAEFRYKGKEFYGDIMMKMGETQQSQ